MAEVVIIDYGMGNLHSVYKSLVKVVDKKSKIKISNSLADIHNCSHIVFPGQGAVSECMNNIKKHLDIGELLEVIKQKPFLGICMGLQVLMTESDENEGTDCLDIIDGKVMSLKNHIGDSLKIPHMGWNNVNQVKNHPLWYKIDNNSRFYSVHSYYVNPTDTSCVMGTTEYGQLFASAIAINKIFAVQFHPEKSQSDGLQLLRNFVEWT